MDFDRLTFRFPWGALRSVVAGCIAATALAGLLVLIGSVLPDLSPLLAFVLDRPFSFEGPLHAAAAGMNGAVWLVIAAGSFTAGGQLMERLMKRGQEKR